MNIDLTNMALTGKIDPFNWGMNWSEIQNIYPDWNGEIEQVLKHNEGFLMIDSVEFYFEEEGLNSLCEIVIKNFQLNENYKSKYFSQNWFNSKLNYSMIKSKFEILKINYEETKGPGTGTPIILPNRNTIFALYEDDLELSKIYIRRNKYDNQFLNGNKYKIEKYTND